jgi:erythrocyte band 7 integral membrane protein
MSASTSFDYHTTAASTTSSSRPLFGTNHSNEHINTPSTNMTDSGKAPAYSPGTNGTNGTRSAPRTTDEPIVKVQPPRREDLQPSYARVIEPDDADADGHGWYGGMVCPPPSTKHPI